MSQSETVPTTCPTGGETWHCVPIISQSTPSLCWEACARMMWYWKHRGEPGKEAGYTQAAGRYLRVTRGLGDNEMDTFYRSLGMAGEKNPNGEGLRRRVQKSPVVTVWGRGASGHAVLVNGYDERRQCYSL